MRTSTFTAASLFALWTCHAGAANPQTREPTSTEPIGSAPAPSEPAAPAQPPEAPFTFGGYAEVNYQWNLNQPSNGLTNLRGFDNRHNTFTLSNVALDVGWDYADLIGKVTLQVGHTPSTYYLAETSEPGSGGANGSDAELWKYVQQAYAGYRFDVGRGLTVSAGLFLSPIGPESIVVHDNWNLSRSNLFFGLPFYHTGVRASYELSDTWSATLAGYNGWNTVVDNNDEKSISAQLTYTRPDLAVSILYFGGVERPDGALEGRGWRNLFDAHVTWHATTWFSVLAQANSGFEETDYGTSYWGAGALYARFQPLEPLFVALRGDAFAEHVPENAAGRASSIFWPAPWVSSATATIDFRPHERASFQLELRHDRAGGDSYFGADVPGDGLTTPFEPNRRTQSTLTVGATTWF
jgi:hypothetical protein